MPEEKAHFSYVANMRLGSPSNGPQLKLNQIVSLQPLMVQWDDNGQAVEECIFMDFYTEEIYCSDFTRYPRNECYAALIDVLKQKKSSVQTIKPPTTTSSIFNSSAELEEERQRLNQLGR